MLDHFKGRMVDEGGVALVEYALLLAFISVVSLGTLNTLGIRVGECVSGDSTARCRR